MDKKEFKKRGKRDGALNILLMAAVIAVIIFSLSLSFYTVKKVGCMKDKMLGKVIVAEISVCIDVPLPVLDGIGDLEASVGVLFEYEVNATSPSNRSVYYYDNTTIFEINRTTGWINFTPVTENIDNHTIKISARHDICPGSGGYEIINFEVKGNHPPEWSNETPVLQNLTEDSSYWFNLTEWVTDADNDPITFYSNNSAAEFPSFSLDENTGILDFTPNDYDVGIHHINMTAYDGYYYVPKVFTFNVSNINDPPILYEMPSKFYLCEDVSFYYDVNASDDDLLIPNSTEKLYFYDNTNLFVINEDTGEISFTPVQTMAGYHDVRIYVTDEEAWDYADSEFIIIPTNDAPVLDCIGAKTVWVNETLYFIANATDEEDGNNSDGNLNFSDNTSLFNIDATTGIVNFTPNDSEIDTYAIEICVSDKGIAPHPNISLCNDSVVKTTCETISLTVTDENRAPNITSHYPEDLVLEIEESQSIKFNITKYDPDGTIPTTYWYKNNELVKINQDNYTFATAVGNAGSYKIKAVISDGELNDSVQWNVAVVVKERGGGGGGGGTARCIERWVCTDWSECQNISVVRGNLNHKLYTEWADKCMKLIEKINMTLRQCGIQIRECTDTSNCSTTKNKPEEIMACRLFPIPSCFDRIRNCHHGACEILVDCGGPCPECPIEIPKPEILKPATKRVVICGDDSCHVTELFTCMKDCYSSWIMWLMAMAAVLLVISAVRKRKKREKEEKQKEAGKEILRDINKNIYLAKDAVSYGKKKLAKETYKKILRSSKQLPLKSRKQVEAQLQKLHQELSKRKRYGP